MTFNLKSQTSHFLQFYHKVRKTINGKLVTFIEVMECDVFGVEEMVYGDYLNKFPVTPENHSKNISVEEIELPF